MSVRLTCCVLVAAALLSNAGRCVASSIVNGSFETGDFTGWGTATGSGTITDPSTGIYFGGASDGTHALQMNDDNRLPSLQLGQTVATQAGQLYRLSFDYGRFDPNRDPVAWESQIRVEVVGLGGGAILLSDTFFDNRQDLGEKGHPLTSSQFLHAERDFFTSDSSVLVLFTDLSRGTYGADTMLDNVELSSVPEPATWASLAIGAFCVGMTKVVRRVTSRKQPAANQAA
ncbi:MAG: PEP-CTERM sorting domain-containing protein [Planctomycetota bacterium]|nr:PEP-CTERM sorting domain-containing protein [Planctomycetota bacterium]